MTKEAFDITQFEARDTAFLEVQNIKDDGPLLFNGAPVRIEIRSPGTKEARAAKHKHDQAQSAKNFAAVRGKPVKETADDVAKNRASILAAVTASVENFPVSATEIYENPKLGWITDQVDKFAADWSNF